MRSTQAYTFSPATSGSFIPRSIVGTRIFLKPLAISYGLLTSSCFSSLSSFGMIAQCLHRNTPSFPESLRIQCATETVTENPKHTASTFVNESNSPKPEQSSEDKPESKLRFGPAEPVRAELWSESDAELVMYLFDIYNHLMQNEWLQSPIVPWEVSLSDDNFHVALAEHGDCMDAIIQFCELYSYGDNDDVFDLVCTIHNRHCPKHHAAHGWIDYYRTTFYTLLEQPIGIPLPNCDIPAKRYFDTVVNGARAGDVTSTPAVDLKNLLAQYPWEIIVIGHRAALRNLLRILSMAVPVLKQNTGHWIRNLGWVGGEVFDES